MSIRTFHFDPKKYGFELLMDLHRFETNPNLEFVPDVHVIDYFEVFFFEETQGELEINGFKKTLQPHTILFVSPYQRKRLMAKEEGAKGFHLVFQSDFLASFFTDKLFVYRLQYFYNIQRPQFFELSLSDYLTIKLCLWEVVNEIKSYQTDSTHIIRSLIYFVLTKLNRLYGQYHGISSETQHNTEAYRFKEALEANYTTFHQVVDYANLLKVTRNKLNKVVKQQYGQSASQLINARIMQAIKSELLYTEKTISEIAFELNFSEANNLSRFFSRLSGQSPTEFRQQQQIDR